MSFSAILPVASMAAANSELASKGWGPDNFSVPAYAGSAPTHALFHSWDIAGFRADAGQIANITTWLDGRAGL